MHSYRSIATLAFALLPPSDAAAQCVSQAVTNPSGYCCDNFGVEVASDGSTLLVGASHTDIAGPSNGACVAYEEVAGAWAPSSTFHPTDGLQFGLFGQSIALQGDLALVGAPFTEIPVPFAGAAFVMRRQGGSWQQIARLSPQQLETYDIFGWQVALDQGRALVSAIKDDDGGAEAGAVYVFEEVAGAWIETDKLVAQGVVGLREFGGALSVEGDHLLVSAASSALGGTDRGAVVTYERQGSSWVETGALPASGVVDGSFFGADALLHGERAFAAGKTGSSAGPTRVHVFERIAGNWIEDEVLTLPNDLSAGGWDTLAAADDRLIVSSSSAQLGNGGWGAAYLFRRTPGGYVHEAELVAPGSYYFGRSMAMLSFDRVLISSNSSTQLSSVYDFDLPAYAAGGCQCSSAAPCANPDEIGGCLNSSGHGARMYACGDASVAADGLELRARKLPTNQPAVLLAASDSLPSGASLPLGDGLLCGSGTIQHFGVAVSGANGELAWGLGLASVGGWAPGETWNFQVWFRDPSGPCGSSSNTSSAVSVRFAP